MKFYIIAGEASGDLHGSNLIKELRKLDPSANIRCWGGDLMKAYYAARETHHKKTEAVTAVFVDRLVGLWAMLLFAGAMMLLNVPSLPKRTTREFR